jgi:hypothetical protein
VFSPQVNAADWSDPSLRGLWFGKEINGRPSNGVINTVFFVGVNKLLVVSGQGVFASLLKCSPDKKLPELGLDRYDGHKQQGVYRVVGTELHMTLADPGKGRPSGDSVEKAGGVPHAHYVFQRMPTEEGLALLQMHADQLLTQVAAEKDE